ncbi:Rmf/CrpP fold protein [Streptomyces ossamyceticus]|uniref:Rmf/CrpP fold protein n=1 Tax=Streptomyces ossamyceticus TaxID=249581 RepID=UPI000A4BF028|nr:Rmf/CrpP fold protein [Streptomyces ossamyceticus]
MGTREDIVRAVTAGREAGKRGDPPTSCPYPSTATLRTAWIRGYAETRPVSSQPETTS